MERFYLKTWSIGFEVPFLDTEDPQGQAELASDVSDRYLNWFDCLRVSLETLELPNTNQLVLFTIVVRVDTDLTNPDTLESDWNKMKADLQSVIEKFLNGRNLTYKILH